MIARFMGRGAAAALSLLAACSKVADGSADAGTGGVDRGAVLGDVADNVVLPIYRGFAGDAAMLRSAAEAHAAALASGSTAAPELEEVRSAWREAMGRWQEAEVVALGPAGSSASFTQGGDLRDEIYSYPTTNPCRVDQKLVELAYERADFFETELVIAYGLDAVEYLVFHDGPDNACPPQVTINQGPWQALSLAEIRLRRARYAARAAGRIDEHASQLVSAWSPEGGDFAGQLRRAGQDGSAFTSARDALDELYTAMFYVDLILKDQKLAVPAGLSPDCTQAVCPEAVEHRFAHVSKESIERNLIALKRVLMGGEAGSDGLGFDDLLADLGAEALASNLLTETDRALEAARAIDGTLAAAVARDPTPVVDLHAAVKRVTDLLKSQLVTVLGLRVPDEGAGDND